MLRRILNASWPLVDQGVVSIGTFAVNLILARNLPPAEYGVFALLVSAFLTFQVVNTSVLFHPLVVRLPHEAGADARHLVTATCLLTVCTTLPLAGLIGFGLVHAGRGDLLPCALAAFVAAQLQEASRRCLFAELRHRTAVPGDGVSYLGQGALVLLLAAAGHLTLQNTLWAMAGTSLVALALQLGRLRFCSVAWSDLLRVAVGFWAVGRWILAYSAVSFLRLQIFPWALAATYGPATAAMFQAAMNVLNVANPVLLGLSNVIPQVAARAQAGHEAAAGNARSWQAVRIYPLLGLPFVLVSYGLALAVPDLTLRVLYGPTSDYLVLTGAVQILALSAMLAYGADMLSSFLHGVNAARTALAVNLTGAAAVVVLAFPVIRMFGLTGCCVALAIASAVRLASAVYAVAFVTNPNRARIALATAGA